jgi:hypothetical protein
MDKSAAGSVVTGNGVAKMRQVVEGMGANLSASSYCVTTNDFYDVSGGMTKETSKEGNVQDATGRTGGKQQFISMVAVLFTELVLRLLLRSIRWNVHQDIPAIKK